MTFDLFFSIDGVCQIGHNTDYPIHFVFESENDEVELKSFLKNHDVIMSSLEGNSTAAPVKFLFSNIAFMDIDDGKTIEDIETELKDTDFILYSSKSHRKNKNGKVCDRFHVLFPLKRKIIDDKEYKKLLARIIKHFKSDPKCKEVNRKFYGPGNVKNYYFKLNNGKNDIVEYLEEKGASEKAEKEEEELNNFDNISLSEDLVKKIERIGFIPISQRHNTLLKMVCDLVFFGEYTKENIYDLINKINVEQCESKIPEKEIADMIEWAFRVAEKKEFCGNYHKTEQEMARLFTDLFGDIFRYSNEKNVWYYYNGKFWEPDIMLQINQHVSLISYILLSQAKKIEDRKDKKRAVNWAMACGNRSKINSIESLARQMLTIKQDDFDKNKSLLNLNNGVFNFDTMAFEPHNKEYFITKIAPVDFDPKAKYPGWKKALKKMYDTVETENYIQKAFGLACTGHSLKAFHFLYGPKGNNGKTTTLNVIRNILGVQNGYCVDTPIDSLVFKNNDSESGVYQSRLKGARLVIATECNFHSSLHTTFIKSFTGGDAITAREKYARYAISFIPEGKLFISGNDRLKINDDSHAMWDRVRLIEYNKQIPEDEIIPDFWDVICKKEGSGILNWLIEGYGKYKEEGLKPDKNMKSSVQEYRHEEDFIQQFLDDEIIITGDSNDFIKTSSLHEQFIEYAKKHGDRFSASLSIQAFTKKVLNKELEYKRTSTARGFIGLKFNGENIENKF